LVTAFLRIGSDTQDICRNDSFEDCGYKSCDACSVKDDCSVLLEGLSGAMNLELQSELSMVCLLLYELLVSIAICYWFPIQVSINEPKHGSVVPNVHFIIFQESTLFGHYVFHTL
jgi:hypothetical protein